LAERLRYTAKKTSPALAEILHQVFIKAAPEAVYDAIATEQGLSSWWTTDVHAETKVGSIAEFGFNNRATVFEMRVVALDPPHFIRWHCLAGHSEWANTDIVFSITPHKGGALLRFAHRGWESSEGLLAQCSYDWAIYLSKLKSYVETGEPQTA
jgi:uncharacterized protein YndB with AHSA1/START domain